METKLFNELTAAQQRDAAAVMAKINYSLRLVPGADWGASADVLNDVRTGYDPDELFIFLLTPGGLEVYPRRADKAPRIEPDRADYMFAHTSRGVVIRVYSVQTGKPIYERYVRIPGAPEAMPRPRRGYYPLSEPWQEARARLIAEAEKELNIKLEVL